ncbi:MAG: hypothetical protein LBQ95_03240 [Lachnospiraceae bacterium]|jgi:HD superfamily phosphodiesterase|nr:hypothetical protein [Lachnospiraceae bacterium]
MLRVKQTIKNYRSTNPDLSINFMDYAIKVLKGGYEISADTISSAKRKVALHGDDIAKQQKLPNEIYEDISGTKNFDNFLDYAMQTGHYKYYGTGLHGLNHIENVTLFSYYIASREGLSWKDTLTVLEASRFHDVGRENDYVMPHGKDGADRYLRQCSHNPDVDIQTVALLIEAHDIGDPKKVAKFGRQNNAPANFERLAHIVRDADAIDRARITVRSADNNLNATYLVNHSAKELILTSEVLNILQDSRKNSFLTSFK